MVESLNKGESTSETILEILADFVHRYHKAVSSDNLKFVDIHASLVLDLYLIANEAGIPPIEAATVFVAASPAQKRRKVLAVLTSKDMLSQKEAGRLEREFGIPSSPPRVRRV